MTATVLDRLAERLDAALAHNPNASAAPVALLWPDGHRDWEPVVARLRDRFPVVALGDYEPEVLQGPAYWVRCVVGGVAPVPGDAGTPIIYMPGVGREDLRAVESCPANLAPIAELQYRSEWFSHPNGRDWTLRGFFSSEAGLGLQLADDAATVSALRAAIGLLLDTPLVRLAGKHLNADDFNELLSPDPTRQVLEWLDDPVVFKAGLDADRWSAFGEQCKSKFDFDLGQGEIEAARLLGTASGPWKNVWQRFREAPASYPGIPGRLRGARPDQLFTDQAGAWPQDNEHGEAALREELAKFAGVTRTQAAARIAELGPEHARRRESVWADLGKAPLAFALEHLERLAQATAIPLAGASVEDVVSVYVADGWQADDALVAALREAPSAGDREAVGVAAEALYREWAYAGATALQAAVGPMANAGTYEAADPPTLEAGDVVVFVDGLRFDVGRQLERRLLGASCDVDVSPSLAALPTVTPTAKPAVAPVGVGDLAAGKDFSAARAESGALVSASVLRSLMEAQGIEAIGPDADGDGAGKGWTEAGEIDHRGHDQGIGLVDVLASEVESVAKRVLRLLDAGWTRVHVVTDHGWLLLPTSLDKQDLPAAVTEKKKGRCARLKAGAEAPVMTVPWHWDKDVRIAIAPGITCFEAGKTYEHGGVSPQECIVPRMVIQRTTRATPTTGARIVSYKWLGLMCRVEFASTPPGTRVDLRGSAGDPGTSVAVEAKETTGDGRASLIVADEDLTNEPAKLVLVSADGDVLAQREITIGVNR